MFEAVASLRVNPVKSSLFSINADHYIEDLTEVLGCEEVVIYNMFGAFFRSQDKRTKDLAGVWDRCTNKTDSRDKIVSVF